VFPRATVESVWRGIESGAVIVLTGANGTGKTLLACAMIRRRIHTPTARFPVPSGRYVTAKDLFDAMRTEERYEPDRTREQTNQFRRCGLLVIDEIDAIRGTDFEDLVMRDLIDFRWREGTKEAPKATLLISNRDQASLETTLPNSVLDRARGGGIFEMTGESRRGA